MLEVLEDRWASSVPAAVPPPMPSRSIPTTEVIDDDELQQRAQALVSRVWGG